MQGFGVRMSEFLRFSELGFRRSKLHSPLCLSAFVVNRFSRFCNKHHQTATKTTPFPSLGPRLSALDFPFGTATVRYSTGNSTGATFKIPNVYGLQYGFTAPAPRCHPPVHLATLKPVMGLIPSSLPSFPPVDSLVFSGMVHFVWSPAPRHSPPDTLSSEALAKEDRHPTPFSFLPSFRPASAPK
jgi:hypothetical protein